MLSNLFICNNQLIVIIVVIQHCTGFQLETRQGQKNMRLVNFMSACLIISFDVIFIQGGREVEDFIKYIKENASNPPVAIAGEKEKKKKKKGKKEEL